MTGGHGSVTISPLDECWRLNPKFTGRCGQQSALCKGMFQDFHASMIGNTYLLRKALPRNLSTGDS